MNPAGGPVPRVATYRLQFSPAFGFAAAQALLPYLHDLGISHIYASPIARAHPGSRHGYDVCNPCAVNPELGTRDELLALLGAVRGFGMGWLQDIVPNHLAVSPHNPYWWDVLRCGRRSPWAFLFDIDWEHPDLAGRILLPVLGEPYARLLAAGAFRLAWEDAGPVLAYQEHRLPLSLDSVATLLAQAGVARELGAALQAVAHADDAPARAAALAAALRPDAASAAAAAAALAAVVDPEAIDRVVQVQAWQPAWWRTGQELIGYRRFFAVDSLIAIRMEDPRAFPVMHGLVLELHDLGLIDGVRVDHIDGLRDPAAYLQRLRARMPAAWIVVEKILCGDERLPAWPVDGTTGYEVLNALTAVCCDPASAARLTALHGDLTGAPAEPTALATQLRQDLDRVGLGGDLDRTVAALRRTADCGPWVRDLGRRTLRDALRTLLARLPAYRTYAAANGAGADDRAILAQARAQAERDRPALAPAIGLLGDLLERGLRPGAPPALAEAVVRVQQLSGPAMAKGFEDTFLFRWSCCLALNEVGGDPRRSTLAVDAFLRAAALRAPAGGLNTTSTHDTKRGEDVRTRLAALTWCAARWEDSVRGWFAADADRAAAGRLLPSAEDRYQLYQTLVGTWPDDGRIDATYRERLQAYALKAVREAGAETEWNAPMAAYEQAVRRWLDVLLDAETGSGFQAQLGGLVDHLARHAGALGLVQTVLKCTLPGVPDIYQGADWHDRSLTDPDNRRAVDFHARAQALAGATWLGPPGDLRAATTKQTVLRRCLRARRDHPAPWAAGSLRALPVQGDAGSVIAFSRRAGRAVALVIADVAAEPAAGERTITLEQAWQAHAWRDALTGRELQPGRAIALRAVLADLPCAVLLPVPG